MNNTIYDIHGLIKINVLAGRTCAPTYFAPTSIGAIRVGGGRLVGSTDGLRNPAALCGAGGIGDFLGLP